MTDDSFKKKNRSANFSKTEINLLCTLVVKYSKILESKITNAFTWKQKMDTWTKLAVEFNAKNNGNPRTTLSLKTKYDSFKKDLRKKVASNKQEMFKTGGGIGKFIPLTSCEELIYNLICLSIEGLSARHDDDAPSTEKPVSVEVNETNNSANDVDENIGEISEENIYIEFEEALDGFQVDVMEQRNVQTDPIIEQEDVQTDARDQQTVQTTRQWNPTQLKKPVSKDLKVRRTNVLTKLQASQKVNILAEAKKELIDLQKMYLQKEIEFEERERELKLKKTEKELENILLDREIKLLEKEIKQETLKKLLNSNYHSRSFG